MSLWNKTIRKIQKNSPQIRTQITKYKYQRASFCTCEKASLTVEASIIIPLTIGFLGCILFFFRILQVQGEVEEALMYAGRNVAVVGSNVSSEVEQLLLAEAYMVSALEEKGDAAVYIKDGVLGISLFGSEAAETYVTLHAEYKVRLPVSFFGVDSIKLASENRFQKWVGEDGSHRKKGWVYVTPSGTVYHTSSHCRVLDLTVRQAPLSDIATYRGKNGQKYYSCGSCKKDGVSVVYYTDYGTLYHYDLVCSVIKRTVRTIPISEVGGRKECTFCQKYGWE